MATSQTEQIVQLKQKLRDLTHLKSALAVFAMGSRSEYA